MRRSGLISLVGILFITFTLLGLSIGFGNTPLLGLDLQGGVEVVLRPTEGQEVTTESLDLSTEIIRRRVDSFGVAEPDVTRQGDNIVVQLPGIDDQERAVELVGQTGKLEFRPVLGALPLTCRERVVDTQDWVIQDLNSLELSNPDEIMRVSNIISDAEQAILEYDTALENGESVPVIAQCIGVEPEPEPERPQDPPLEGPTPEFYEDVDPSTDFGADSDQSDFFEGLEDDTENDEANTEDEPTGTTEEDGEGEESSTTWGTDKPEEASVIEAITNTKGLAEDSETSGFTRIQTDTTGEVETEEAPVTGESDDPETNPQAPDTPEPPTTSENELEEPGTEPEINIVPPEPDDSQLLLDAVSEVYGSYSQSLELVVTNPTTADPNEQVIYVGESAASPGAFQKYVLGPALLDGSALKGANAVLTGISSWVVQLDFHSGEEGIDLFNMAARTCAGRQPECPDALLGIVLDGNVESAPTVGQVNFDPDDIVITGNFSESEARNLALILQYGALPLEFDDPVEAGLVRSVSATLGKDSLNAGIIAGIVGIILVAIYMTIYYRIVGLTAIISLIISGLLLWVVVSFLSETQGLALTLAGITGLIVSIGVSLDSNVVYFENLKEDLINGKTLRSSVDQAFPKAFRTIFWANLATLIGAGILWWLTIGSVKGFAAMLGIASILDLVVTYFFLRPAVRFLAHSKIVKKRSRWLIGVEDNVPE